MEKGGHATPEPRFMNRAISILLAPETVLSALTGFVIWFSSRHASGHGGDAVELERLLGNLPWFIVPLSFATIWAPGARNWWWLGRTIVFTFVALCVGAERVIARLGTGAQGQDAALATVLLIGLGLVSVGTVLSIGLILSATRPGFTEWFRSHPILGSILGVFAVFPIGVGLGTLLTMCLAIVFWLWSLLIRLGG